jgi:serine/threonine-protein kinase
MGEVVRAHDLHLGRDLAVKVLLPQYRGEPRLVQRFLAEARIHGRLQHPGIAPVHELGALADGRPYFTMKLVQGRTLADLLDERADPHRDLSCLLTVFEQACQAVAYAHSQGVIHRDLKPANVMVGAFGEVQVMDWGLAKTLPQAGEGGRTGREPDGSASPFVLHPPTDPATQPGTVLGTPAYMAPEQARGDAERLDERCDVFGLGAILCEILTGQPPYAGGDPDELMRQAARAELGGAITRLSGCGADEELVALCRDCLAAAPEGRPCHGGEVAARLAAHQAAVQQQLRAAELERAATQARAAEERRRLRAQLGLAAAALLFLATGGGVLSWAWRQHEVRDAEIARRRENADAAVGQPLADARRLLDEARKAASRAELAKSAEALAAAQNADNLAQNSEASDQLRQQAAELLDAIDREVAAVKRDRRLLDALLEVRAPHERKYVRDDVGYVVALSEPTAEEQFKAAFLAWDPHFDPDVLPTGAAAARVKGRPPAVRTEVIAGLDEWAGDRRARGAPADEWQRLADLAAALDDPDSKRAELRILLARGTVRRERPLGAPALWSGPVPVPFEAALKGDRNRLRRLAAATVAADEPVLGLLTLEQALRAAGENAVAERLLRAAVLARPQEPVLRNALGKLLERQRPPRWIAAVACYEAARALRPEFGEALANALVNGGCADDGLALYERLATEKGDNPWLHLRRGFALHRLHRYEEAEAAFRTASARNAQDADAYFNMGVILKDEGRMDDAIAEWRKACELNPRHANARYNLGIGLQQTGRHDEAIRESERAATLDPDPGRASAWYNLGLALHDARRDDEAVEAYARAITLSEQIVYAHGAQGEALERCGRFAEAVAATRRCLGVLPATDPLRETVARQLGRCERLLAHDPRLPAILRGDSPAAGAPECLDLGQLCQHKRRYAASARFYADAFAADPTLARHSRYGAAGSAALAAAGRGKDAEGLPDKVIAVLRRQALEWLRADLALLAEYLEAATPEAAGAVQRALRGWLQDKHLASVRDQEALAQFPAAEREPWQTLWADVAHHLAKAEARSRHLGELERRLSHLLGGEWVAADVPELLTVARRATQGRLEYAATARLIERSLSAHPEWAGRLWPDSPCYYGACCSAMAAAGEGAGADGLDDAGRRRMRRQALAWLRAELSRQSDRLAAGNAADHADVAASLAYWQVDGWLASVRDQAALGRLPEDERQAWHQFWDHVAALLKKVEEKK